MMPLSTEVMLVQLAMLVGAVLSACGFENDPDLAHRLAADGHQEAQRVCLFLELAADVSKRDGEALREGLADSLIFAGTFGVRPVAQA